MDADSLHRTPQLSPRAFRQNCDLLDDGNHNSRPRKTNDHRDMYNTNHDNDHDINDHDSMKYYDHYGGGDHDVGKDDNNYESNYRNGHEFDDHVNNRYEVDHGAQGHDQFGRNYNEQGKGTSFGQNIVHKPPMTWIDRRAFNLGDACAPPPDWKNHPILNQVGLGDEQAYRQSRLEDWLTVGHRRHPSEKFGQYIWRASAVANSELKQRKKQCFADEYTNSIDKFVMRLFYGMKLRLERSESVILSVDEETFVLGLLREECEVLYKSGQLYPDQKHLTQTMSPDLQSTSRYNFQN